MISVKELQIALNKASSITGMVLVEDGIAGRKTTEAVKAFQKAKGLISDGIAGERTLHLLLNTNIKDPLEGKLLTEEHLVKSAKVLGLEVNLLKSFSRVESGGMGFGVSNGKPYVKMLFERHIMARQLKAAGLDLLRTIAMEAVPNLVNTSPGGYKGGVAENERLSLATQLNRECAYNSASYGRYQIMGFHHANLGYDSAFDMLSYMEESENNQLDVLVEFIRMQPNLHEVMRDKNFVEMARIYNGPNYYINNYDKKLEEAYKELEGN